jgi:hypothetical protein
MGFKVTFYIYIIVVNFIVGGTRCAQRKPTSAGHRQTLSHNVVSNTPRHERDLDSHMVIDTDCIDSWKPNYHAIKTTKSLSL